MNIKCLLYARYTTSIPINVIVNDLTNRALSAEIDRVIRLSCRFPIKLRGWNRDRGRKINLERAMEYGMSRMMMIVMFHMRFAPARIIWKKMLINLLRSCRRKLGKLIIVSIKLRKILSIILKIKL